MVESRHGHCWHEGESTVLDGVVRLALKCCWCGRDGMLVSREVPVAGHGDRAGPITRPVLEVAGDEPACTHCPAVSGTTGVSDGSKRAAGLAADIQAARKSGSRKVDKS